MVQCAVLALSLLETPEHRGKGYASVVIYLDESEYRGDSGSFTMAGPLEFSLSLRYKVIRLWDVDPEPILSMDAPGLWPFVVLMRGNPERLIVQSKERILDASEHSVPFDGKRILMAILGAFAARRVPDRTVLEALLREVRKMGENLFFDLLIEEGIEKGLEKGIEKGIEKGRREALTATLKRVLGRRFGLLDAETLRRLEGIEKPEEIERSIDEAVVAPTLEAFLEAMGGSRRG